jgi:hypothetical protein
MNDRTRTFCVRAATTHPIKIHSQTTFYLLPVHTWILLILTMANRSIDFNNTAVRLMRVEDQSSTGNVVNPLVALDMFQGALEVLLDETRRLDDQERQGHEDHRPNEGEVDPASCEEPVPTPTPTAPERPVTQETLNCVQRAELHLETINAYFAEQSLTGDNPILPPSLMVQARHDNSRDVRDAIVVPVRSRGYNPYLYKIPFTIAQPMDEDSHLNGSIIVYNIGLAHQLLDSGSVVAPVFYQKAAALLSSVPMLSPISNDTLLLRLSLVNNYGVSCAENGDGETMRTCMEQLARSLDEHESTEAYEDGVLVDATIRDGFRSNIQHLLTPSHGGSPVA